MNTLHIGQKLGASLVEMGLISTDQLTIALIEQRQQGHLLGQQLVRLGFLTEGLLRDVLAQRLSQESIDLQHMVPDAELLALIPQSLARKQRLVPLSLTTHPSQLEVAATAVLSPAIIEQLRLLVQQSGTFAALASDASMGRQLSVKTLLATESDVEQALDRCYGHVLSLEGILREIEQEGSQANQYASTGVQDARPVVRLVDAILLDAIKQEASDIHFEPEQGYVRIRYRVDGVLEQIRSLHGDHWPAMCVRLKIMAGMDIAEQRSPQDGRMQWRLGGRDIDFRVSSQPTLHGENLVLRLLDRNKAIVPLAQLGLPAPQLEQLHRMLEKPEGLLIVTGPTGSGKTTTLYSLLNHLNQPEVNIMTLEDPVEYPVQRMRQTSVSGASKVDFASGVRAILRQDPDIILVGEVRDEATAAMALRAAMTGHQVMTTLHCNRAVGAYARLQDLGVSMSLLRDNLIGVIGQRLLRRLCPYCKSPESPPASLQMLSSQLKARDVNHLCYQPVGCDHCHHRGYRGRFVIMEILEYAVAGDCSTAAICDETDRPVTKDAGIHFSLKPYASLAEAGMRAVMAGETSLQELKRVVDVSMLTAHDT